MAGLCISHVTYAERCCKVVRSVHTKTTDLKIQSKQHVTIRPHEIPLGSYLPAALTGGILMYYYMYILTTDITALGGVLTTASDCLAEPGDIALTHAPGWSRTAPRGMES